MLRRNTIQRSLVYEAVNTLQNHATADEIYELIAKDHPHISKGTVYRNLSQLAKDGEIRRVEVPGGPDRYDHRCHNHSHAMGQQCGRVFDIEMAYIEDLEKEIEDAHGFAVSGHDIMFRGVCPDCQRKGDD